MRTPSRNGFLTLLSDGERLTGAYALGPEAGEWLQQATLAIRAHVPLDVLRDTIQPFPTFSEIYVAALKALSAEIAAAHDRRHRTAEALTEGDHDHRNGRAAHAREPGLLGQTVVVIGGSAGIGLETARRARAEGADVILTGRNPDRLEQAASRARRGAAPRRSTPTTSLPSRGSSTDLDGPDRPRDGHGRRPLLRAAGRHGLRRGAPRAPGASDGDARRRPLRRAARSGPEARCCSWAAPAAAVPAVGLGIISAVTAALPALTASLALEIAPVRVNLIAAGFVDTPLSASLLGDQLDARRNELRTTLPIGRVVGPDDVAALAVHLMTNTALTGATYDIDGGQQLVFR